jgi:DNA-binding response OmpR family regulator
MAPHAREPVRVLVVEDSAPIRELVMTVLRRGGYETIAAADGEEGLELFYARRPDLVVLDLWLPRVDGWNVLQRIRELDDEVPILVMTALDDEGSKIRGLTWGADDYVVKPVGAGELLARVAALLRRARHRRHERSTEPVHDDGFIQVDHQRRKVAVAGTEVALSPLEFRLLCAFVRRPDELLTREDLLEDVWHDYSGGTSDHVKIYVGYLRRKLAQATDIPLIETVRGHGYRWTAAALGARAGAAASARGHLPVRRALSG